MRQIAFLVVALLLTGFVYAASAPIGCVLRSVEDGGDEVFSCAFAVCGQTSPTSGKQCVCPEDDGTVRCVPAEERVCTNGELASCTAERRVYTEYQVGVSPERRDGRSLAFTLLVSPASQETSPVATGMQYSWNPQASESRYVMHVDREGNVFAYEFDERSVHRNAFVLNTTNNPQLTLGEGSREEYSAFSPVFADLVLLDVVNLADDFPVVVPFTINEMQRNDEALLLFASFDDPTRMELWHSPFLARQVLAPKRIASFDFDTFASNENDFIIPGDWQARQGMGLAEYTKSIFGLDVRTQYVPEEFFSNGMLNAEGVALVKLITWLVSEPRAISTRTVQLYFLIDGPENEAQQLLRAVNSGAVRRGVVAEKIQVRLDINRITFAAAEATIRDGNVVLLSLPDGRAFSYSLADAAVSRTNTEVIVRPRAVRVDASAIRNNLPLQVESFFMDKDVNYFARGIVVDDDTKSRFPAYSNYIAGYIWFSGSVPETFEVTEGVDACDQLFREHKLVLQELTVQLRSRDEVVTLPHTRVLKDRLCAVQSSGLNQIARYDREQYWLVITALVRDEDEMFRIQGSDILEFHSAPPKPSSGAAPKNSQTDAYWFANVVRDARTEPVSFQVCDVFRTGCGDACFAKGAQWYEDGIAGKSCEGLGLSPVDVQSRHSYVCCYDDGLLAGCGADGEPPCAYGCRDELSPCGTLDGRGVCAASCSLHPDLQGGDISAEIGEDEVTIDGTTIPANQVVTELLVSPNHDGAFIQQVQIDLDPARAWVVEDETVQVRYHVVVGNVRASQDVSYELGLQSKETPSTIRVVDSGSWDVWSDGTRTDAQLAADVAVFRGTFVVPPGHPGDWNIVLGISQADQEILSFDRTQTAGGSILILPQQASFSAWAEEALSQEELVALLGEDSSETPTGFSVAATTQLFNALTVRREWVTSRDDGLYRDAILEFYAALLEEDGVDDASTHVLDAVRGTDASAVVREFERHLDTLLVRVNHDIWTQTLGVVYAASHERYPHEVAPSDRAIRENIGQTIRTLTASTSRVFSVLDVHSADRAARVAAWKFRSEVATQTNEVLACLADDIPDCTGGKINDYRLPTTLKETPVVYIEASQFTEQAYKAFCNVDAMLETKPCETLLAHRILLMEAYTKHYHGSLPRADMFFSMEKHIVEDEKDVIGGVKFVNLVNEVQIAIVQSATGAYVLGAGTRAVQAHRGALWARGVMGLGLTAAGAGVVFGTIGLTDACKGDDLGPGTIDVGPNPCLGEIVINIAYFYPAGRFGTSGRARRAAVEAFKHPLDQPNLLTRARNAAKAGYGRVREPFVSWGGATSRAARGGVANARQRIASLWDDVAHGRAGAVKKAKMMKHVDAYAAEGSTIVRHRVDHIQAHAHTDRRFSQLSLEEKEATHAAKQRLLRYAEQNVDRFHQDPSAYADALDDAYVQLARAQPRTFAPEIQAEARAVQQIVQNAPTPVAARISLRERIVRMFGGQVGRTSTRTVKMSTGRIAIHKGYGYDFVHAVPPHRNGHRTWAVADGVSGASGPGAADTGSRVLAQELDDLVARHADDFDAIYNGMTSKLDELITSSLPRDGSATTIIVQSVTPDGRLISFRIGDTEARILRNKVIHHVDNLVYPDGEESMFNAVRFLDEPPVFVAGSNAQFSVPKGMGNAPNQFGPGNSPAYQPFMSVHQLKPGDVVIATSDGVVKMGIIPKSGGMHGALGDGHFQEAYTRAKSFEDAEKLLFNWHAKLHGSYIDDLSIISVGWGG